MRPMVFLLLACALLAMAGLVPFKGTNVSDLQVAEILCFRQEGENVVVSCDGGFAARGKTVTQAVENLHAAAPGELFLGTVDFVVFTGLEPEAKTLLDVGLRPAVSLYKAPNVEDSGALAKYLAHHDVGVTLGMLQEKGNLPIPQLRQGEGDTLYIKEESP